MANRDTGRIAIARSICFAAGIAAYVALSLNKGLIEAVAILTVAFVLGFCVHVESKKG